MTTTDLGIKFYGLSHLAEKEVDAYVAGFDCGVYTVGVDGDVTVPFGSDPDGLFTAVYLSTVADFTGEQEVPVSYLLADVTISVTISAVFGEGYTSRGQLLRQPVDIRGVPALGEKRRSHMMAVLFENTGLSISFGTDFDHLDPVEFKEVDNDTALPDTSLYSGVYWNTLEDGEGYSFDSMLCWEVRRPTPATVAAISVFLQTED